MMLMPSLDDYQRRFIADMRARGVREDEPMPRLGPLWSHYTFGDYLRDLAHFVRPELPCCRFSWRHEHEYCLTHDRPRLACERVAIAARKKGAR